jgi:peptidoglycan/xylan/chitin deacetylase (PgdA/CDA1 family)
MPASRALLALLAMLASNAEVAAAPPSVRVAVTFDDLITRGPMPSDHLPADVVKRIIAALRAEKVPGVYAFVTSGGPGTSQNQADISRLWRKAGYLFGNHTTSHPALSAIPVEMFLREIETNEPFLREISGGRDWKYFRYPYLDEGDTQAKREKVRAFLARRGYQIAPVTFSLREHLWEKPYAECKERGNKKGLERMRARFVNEMVRAFHMAISAARIANEPRAPQVLMLHGGALQADSLPALLKTLRTEGARFVTLESVMKDKALNRDSGYVSAEPRSYFEQLAAPAGKNIPVGLALPPPISEAVIASLCD